ncbi:MAG: IS30 family transposase [Bacteroidetes bacterium]|nr:IS30 family transposase [Bacteroidota bacterium]
MTKNYSQLTLVQRYQIEALKSTGQSQSAIAKRLGVDKSTISRELNRNIPKRGIGAKIYSAVNAQNKTDTRHKVKPKRELFTADLKKDALTKMRIEKFSPELISAVWKKENKPRLAMKQFTNLFGKLNLVTKRSIKTLRKPTGF